jgi:hypothetical protein
MKYSLKKGVELAEMDPLMLAAIDKLADLWNAMFPEDKDGLTITAGCEGEAGDKVHHYMSLHYPENSPSGFGRAIDIRTWDVGMEHVKEKFLEAARILLGKDFDVVVESDHIHIELDPKRHA